MVMAVGFTDRVGKGIRNPPRDALVAANAGEHQRGLVFGLHCAGDTAGAFVGIAVAAAIIWSSQSAATGLTRQTFQVAVLFSTVPAVLAVLVLAAGAREIRPAAVDFDHPANIGHADRRFKLYLLVVVVFTLGYSSGSFMAPRA
jgi:hypothetical protein